MISTTRFSLLPDVPTADESGLPGFEAVLHYGVLAPAGTPQPIVERLNKAAARACGDRGGQGAHPHRGRRPADLARPEEYAADIDREEAKWAALIRKLGLKVE